MGSPHLTSQGTLFMKGETAPAVTASNNDHHSRSQLDLDVMGCIMELLQRKDILSIMQSCHMLHSIGVKYVLTEPPVLDNPERLLAFCKFVLAEPSRPAYLRKLTIVCLDAQSKKLVPSSTLSLLFQVISGAESLNTFTIRTGSSVLERHATIIAAIQSLPNLRSLDLIADDEGFQSTDLVRGIQSPLEELRAAFSPANQTNAHDVLGTQAASLQVLDLRGVNWGPTGTTPFLAICKLTIRFTDANRDIGRLVRLFPNLKHLGFAPKTDEPLSDQMDQVYDRNKRAHQWPMLEYLGGQIEEIYMAGLNCRVKHLDCHRYNDPEHRISVPEVLMAIRPRMLTFNIEPFLVEFYRQIFRGVSMVSDLRLTLEAYHMIFFMGGSDITRSVLEMLSPLHIKSLTLIWRTNARPEHIRYSASDVQYFREMNIKHFIGQIAKRIPMLRKVTMEIPVPKLSTSHWEIEPSEDDIPHVSPVDAGAH